MGVIVAHFHYCLLTCAYACGYLQCSDLDPALHHARMKEACAPSDRLRLLVLLEPGGAMWISLPSPPSPLHTCVHKHKHGQYLCFQG